MKWNYRVIIHKENGKDVFALHEVHYKGGKPVLFTERPIAVAESLFGLHEVVTLMGSATANAVLMSEGCEPLEASEFEEKSGVKV